MRTVAIINPKGGSGKTTLAANLGATLADLGCKVLLIDLDRQPSLSSHFPTTYSAPHGISHMLHVGTFTDAISRTTIKNLDIVLSDDPDGQLMQWVRDTADGRTRLRFMLEDFGAQLGYDYVIIDSQGARGPYQDVSALAADMLLSPITPELAAAREFIRGTTAMIQELAPLARMGAPLGQFYGVFYRMNRTTLAQQVAEVVRSADLPIRGNLIVLQTVVPDVNAYQIATTKREPIHRYEPERKGSSTPSGRETMLALVRELFPQLHNRQLPE